MIVLNKGENIGENIGEMSVEVLAYHHSHDDFFRSPFGAVQCGSTIRLRLLIQSPNPISECYLRVWVGGEEYLQPLLKGEYPSQFPSEYLDKYHDKNMVQDLEHNALSLSSHRRSECGSLVVIYEVNYEVPEELGLVWYFFVFVIDGNTYFYGNNGQEFGGKGQLSRQEPPGYQLTVYKPMSLPSWYTGGIMYQIYVDRFFNGDEQGRFLNPRPKSLLHGDWYDTPFYVKNEKGEVLRWDFFGGNLLGVIKKLPYLKELGVSIIYFNPIFDSASNHKYDTGNYLAIDAMYGDEEIFVKLVQEAQRLGIAIILDGVFSHTGDDSVYFNRYGNYPSLGAYQSPDSPYHSWYKWKGNKEYSCWWGVKTLPEVQEMEPSYREYIIHSPQGVLQTWMRSGIKGWRLDVADELPDEFIQEFRQVMKKMDPESVLIGEVWEDPTNKFSYGKLRQYFWGAELDATMNYPFREIFLQYLLGSMDASHVHERIMNLYENYPRENFFGQMNLIGSHDRARILTLLGEAPSTEELSPAQQENYRLPLHKRWLATRRLRLFTLIQMSFPGVPCLYYGDEAGSEGYPDPFNRGTYPWGREDPEILEWVKRVLRYRREYKVLQTGEFHSCPLEKEVYAFKRKGEREEILVLVNPQVQEAKEVLISIEQDVEQVIDIFEGRVIFRRELGITQDMGQGVQPMPHLKHEFYLSLPLTNELSLTLPPLTGKALFYQKHPIEQYFKQEIMRRSCGILMHISSLPSPWGIGDMGREAYDFVDFLVEAGQSLWQVLPLNPLGLGDSPYQSESAFAGNPLLISIDVLIQAGLLTEEEANDEYRRYAKSAGYDQDAEYNEGVVYNESASYNKGAGAKGFTGVKNCKEALLRKAFSRFKALQNSTLKKLQNSIPRKHEDTTPRSSSNYTSHCCLSCSSICKISLKDYLDPCCYREFIEDNEKWLRDYALFKCLKIKFPELSWNQWEEKYVQRDWSALRDYARELAEEIEYIYFVQYTFEYQWQSLKGYANEKGVKIIGDIPIFVAYDSCDTWTNREIFALDEQNVPLGTAGVPPDYFSPTGQNWGNPLYDWEILAATDYAWWKLRLKQGLNRFDILRLDHFRGFEAYWEVPAQATTAKEGRWIKGPGKAFFESMTRELGPLPLIAEDLGTITPEVNTLKAIHGYPGMRVFQFSSLKEKYLKEVVYYSGTHDNDTLLGWYLSQGYDYSQSMEQVKKTIEELYQGEGAWVILPLQDVLRLDSMSRMNIPGTIEGNWLWRMERDSLTRKVSAELRQLAQKYGRAHS